MEYSVEIEGYEGHEISLRTADWGGLPTLLFDGAVAASGPRRNQYTLTRNDGAEEVVKFRNSLFDPVPQLVVGDKRINPAAPMPWPETIWCLLPLLLTFTPGLDGILFAFGGCWVNMRLFRSARPLGQRYALTAAVTLGAGLGYLLMTGRVRLPF